LADGSLAAEIQASWAERQKNIARRKDPLTGVSEFPNILEEPVLREPAKPSTRGATKTLAPIATIAEAVAAIETGAALSAVTAALAAGEPARVTPLPRHRVHEDFEALRDAADRYKAANGAWPTIFLANMGTVAQHTARATFSKNFFEAGGIQALGNNGFADPAAAAEAFKASGARIAILCGSDALYETDAVPFAAALKQAGAQHLFLAGNPGERRQDYEQAGIDEFISVGIDVLAVLKSTLVRLGVAL